VAAHAEVGGMNWGGLDAFLAMGGYGFYVWGSYGMAVLCISVEVVLLNKKAKS
jgi:heme exporter protein D